MRYFTTSDNIRLAYRDEGQGLPLVCLPGLSRNGEDFQIVADRFAYRARVIRLDMRGRGQSAYDPEYHNYNLLVEARDVVEFFDHLGLDKVALLGTSRGGMISMMLAKSIPERLAGVMLNDIGPEVDPNGITRIMTYLGLVPEFPDLEAFARATAVAMGGMFPGVSIEQWKTYLGATCREVPGGLALNYDENLRRAILEASVEAEGLAPDLWALFDAMAGLPLAVLRGGNSDILSAETAAQMRARRPDMQFTLVKDRGHVPFLNEPECLAAMDEFFGLVGA